MSKLQGKWRSSPEGPRGSAGDRKAPSCSPTAQGTGMRIAILDDYQGIALKLADWSSDSRPPGNQGLHRSRLRSRRAGGAASSVRHRLHPAGENPDGSRSHRAAAESEADRIDGLPECRDRSRGCSQASRRCRPYRLSSTPTIEFTWALILAIARNITVENARCAAAAGRQASAAI